MGHFTQIFWNFHLVLSKKNFLLFFEKKTKENFGQNFFYFFKQNFFLLFFKQNIWVSKDEKTRGIRLSVALRGDTTFVPVTLRHLEVISGRRTLQGQLLVERHFKTGTYRVHY